MDRETLEAVVDRYLEALVAGDPDRLPLANEVVFVENHQELELGEGLWRTATGLGTYRHVICDPERGQVVLIGVIEERGSPIIFELRLAIENDRIAEIETLVIRSDATQYEQQGQPDDRFREPVPADQRLSRDELVAVANKYFTGMERNDPDDDYSFFHPECDRWEHARLVTNRAEGIPYGHVRDTDFTTLTAEEQFQTGFLGFVTRIRDRRFVAVDVERQTVFAFCFFDHDGTVREVPGPGEEPSTVPPYFSTPRTLPVGEAFRIKDGRIYMIEATLTEAPYGTRPVFPSEDPWFEENRIAPAIATPPTRAQTGREDLTAIAERFRSGLVDRDASRMPVAPDVGYTENGQRLALDDGLWRTVSDLGDYEVCIVDEERGRVGVYATVVEHEVPGVLAARLDVEDRRITEIEAVIVRREIGVDGIGNTQTMFLPMLARQNDPANFQEVDPRMGEDVPTQDRHPRDVLRGLVEKYQPWSADAAGATPGAETCRHRINGEPVESTRSLSGVETVRDERIWAIDRQRGLVLRSLLLDLPNDGQHDLGGLAVGDDATTTVDEEGFGGTYSSFSGPFSILAVQLFAIQDGEIAMIEEQRRTVPYKQPSGWT